jgi:TonB family protein
MRLFCLGTAAALAALAGSSIVPPKPSAYAIAVWHAIKDHKLCDDEQRAKGVRGTVGVAGTVGPGGKLETHRVTKSSDSKLLDELAACKLRKAEYPAPPDGKPFEFALEIRFEGK